MLGLGYNQKMLKRLPRLSDVMFSVGLATPAVVEDDPCQDSQNITPEGPEGVEYTRAQAKQGDAAVQYNLGVMYDLGEGVIQDYSEAVRWYRLAAKQGDAKAQFLLGVGYAKGEGVIQNEYEAYIW